jgi:hypothetical protein
MTRPWWRPFVGLVVILVAWMAMSRPAAAQPPDDPPGRVGRLVELQGVVRLYDQQTQEWIDRPHNWPVTSGDRVRTEPESRAEVHVGSITLRLGGGTDLLVQRLDDEYLSLQLDAGSLALRVDQPELALRTTITTAEGRWSPQQPGHYRIDRVAESSKASVWRGELWFDGSDSRLSVAAGRRVDVWLQGPRLVTQYRWGEIEHDAFADWVQRDEQALARAPAAQYVSPEMTGWQDLDRYGTWVNDAELGGVWIPAVVAGWAPYRYGQWAWVAPWGWTWVDAAPWGFAPFHYGRWLMWRGRWAWAPGHRAYRPVYAPALVAWIGAPALGVGVQIGAPARGRAPPVGWVPLAPWEPYRPQYRAGDRHWQEVNRPHDRLAPLPSGRTPPMTPPSPVPPRSAPAGPATYTNQRVPGAVTVMPGDAFVARQPVAPRAAPADSALVRAAVTAPVTAPAALPEPMRRGGGPRPAPGAALPPPAATVGATPAPAPGLAAPAPTAAPPSPAAPAALPSQLSPTAAAPTAPTAPTAPRGPAVAPIIVAPGTAGQVRPAPSPNPPALATTGPTPAAMPRHRVPPPDTAATSRPPPTAPVPTPAPAVAAPAPAAPVVVAPPAAQRGAPEAPKPAGAKPEPQKADAAPRDAAAPREPDGRQRVPEQRQEMRERQNIR